VLNGILDEVSKVNKLLNFDYLYKRILVPTIKYAAEREYLNEVEVNILMIGIKKQEFRSTDLNEVLSALSARQITHQIAKMKDSGFIQPLKENGRTYFINFMNNFLMRALVKILEREGFIPAIDK
jgi:Fic family protein